MITGCSASAQQSWRLPPPRINSGVLASGVSGECAANSGGTKAVISACGSTSAAQQWAIGNDANIRTLSNLCWTLNGGATASGTAITLATCAGNVDQEFAQGPGAAPWITSVDGSAAGLCVTDPGGSATSGTQLTIAACTSGSSSQKWPLPPTTAPWTPTGVTVTAGAAAATVSWTTASGGGDTLTGYTITATPGGETATAGPYATTATVARLTPGTAYTFTVTANSPGGTAAASAATTAITPGNQTSYAYDAAGNMSRSQTDGITTTNTFNADEELTKSATGSATTNYGYDADGNQTSAGSTTFAYNGAGQLADADTSSGNFAYSYDGSGNLSATSLNGTKIQGTVWDINNQLPLAAEDISPSGATTADYEYGPSAGLSSVSTSSGTYYAVTDWLGSATGLVNSSGTQVSSTAYSAYGTPATANTTSGTPISSIGYAGSYVIPGPSGLDDMRSRVYSQAQGAFMSTDPLTVMTGQPYAYAEDSPAALTDPSGAITCPGWVPGCGLITDAQNDISSGAGIWLQQWESGWSGQVLCGVHEGSIYVTTPRGVTYKVPGDWVSRVADSGKGIVFQDPNSIGVGNGKQNMIRIMEPTSRYPNGYVRIYNSFGQPVDYNLNPGPNDVTHFPEDDPGPFPELPLEP